MRDLMRRVSRLERLGAKAAPAPVLIVVVPRRGESEEAAIARELDSDGRRPGQMVVVIQRFFEDVGDPPPA